MATPILSTHFAPTSPIGIETLADTNGLLVILPAATAAHFRSKGLSAVTLTIVLGTTKAFLTLSEAASMHLQDVDGMTLNNARVKITRACDAGDINSTGEKRRRRIDSDSFAAWRLREREKNLARDDQS